MANPLPPKVATIPTERPVIAIKKPVANQPIRAITSIKNPYRPGIFYMQQVQPVSPIPYPTDVPPPVPFQPPPAIPATTTTGTPATTTVGTAAATTTKKPKWLLWGAIALGAYFLLRRK